MAIRVLVVDDSAFFRRRVCEALNADAKIEVIGTASNGKEAVQQVAKLAPDVVTMDVEMPIMDGVAAVREIMHKNPTPVLMFSSITTAGAKATLDALEAGAMEFLPKAFGPGKEDKSGILVRLRTHVRILGRRKLAKAQVAPKVASPAAKTASSSDPQHAKEPIKKGHRLVAIGCSTGGPVALQHVLAPLPANYPLPILLIQHMPENFTTALAERLNSTCAITVREAQDGDLLRPGVALLAPGGRQMVLESQGAQCVVRVRDALPGEYLKPSVDLAFRSVADLFPGKALAVVLTGMGTDGREGAKLLKTGGSSVWAQNEESCVVYGMPMAVVKAGLADRVMALDEIGSSLTNAA